VNRAERLRRVAPGADAERIEELAQLPASVVDQVAALVRQGRRDEREHQAERKRQRKRDAARYHHYDEADLTRRNLAMVRSQGHRARQDLEALAGLAATERNIRFLMGLAVDGCRARGYSDREIGEALGVTRQAVRQRFPRQGSFPPDGPAEAPVGDRVGDQAQGVPGEQEGAA
jgi:DNA-directed RNA polymerase sigma subunit (sigma70/sigma32)